MQLFGGEQMSSEIKKPQTTHSSEQNEVRKIEGLKLIVRF